MTLREDVETITLDSVVLVRCPDCKSVHAAIPLSKVVRDQEGFQQQVYQLADAHKGHCPVTIVPRCGAKCSASGCGSSCILDTGHVPSQGHWCNKSHQW